MWEWEDQDDDGGGGGGLDAAALLEARRQDLIRREEQAKLEREINALIDDRVKAYKESLKISKIQFDKVAAMAEEQKNINKELEKAKAAQTELSAMPPAETADPEEVKKYTKAIEDAAAAVNNAQKKQKDHSASMKIAATGMLENTKISGKLKKEIEEAMESPDPQKIIDAMDKAKASITQTDKAIDTFDSGIAGLASKMGLAAKVSDTTFGKMAEGAMRVGQAIVSNPITALKGMRNSMLSLFSPLNILGNLFSMVASSFLEIEEAAIAVTKATGASRQETMHLMKEMQAENLEKYNISVKELAQSHIALSHTLSGFNKLNKDAQKPLMQTTANLAKLGIAEKQTAKITRMLSFEFGGVAKGAKKAQAQFKQYIADAQNAGISAQEAASNFEQFGGSIVSMGGKIEEEMAKMNKMAQATGASINQLATIAKKFNTFKTGADSAAKLNAVFGTSISSIELMSVTAEERNKIISESLMMATGGYQAMTDHQRLAAAEMLGFGDNVLALQGYMEGTAELDKDEIKRKEQHAEAMIKLQETFESITPTLTQLANQFKAAMMKSGGFQEIMTQLINNMPTIIEQGKNLANVVFFLAQNIKWLTTAYVGAKVATFAYTKILALAKAAKVTDITVTSLAAMANLSLGYAMLFAFGAIGLVVGVLFLLYKTFIKSGSPPLWQMAAVMAVGIIALGVAMYFINPALLSSLPALALLMGGLALIFYILPPLVEALATLVEAMTGVFTAMTTASLTMPLLAGGLMMVGMAFAFLGSMAAMAAFGIAAGTLALIALRVTMGLTGMSFDKMFQIGEGVQKMGEGIKNLKEGLSGLGTAGAALFNSLGGKNLIISGDGSQATVVAGKGGMFMMLPQKITVDVNMEDKVTMPTPIVNVSVSIDGDELKHIVREEIAMSRG